MATPSIYLDDLRWRDWSSLYSIASHPDFFYRALNDRSAWVAWRTVQYIFKARKGAARHDGQRIVKAIRRAGTRELLGCVLMVDLHKEAAGQAETGTFVAVPYQKRGIGVQARLRFLDWCFERFDLRAVKATVAPGNAASRKMLARSGMREAGFIAAGQGPFYSRSGEPEARVIMFATRPEIESALQKARAAGIYSRDIPVI